MKSRMSLFVVIASVFIAATAQAKTIKMIFWYPGEAGTTKDAQPILDEFTKFLGDSLRPDTVTGKYFNTVEGGLVFINNERPAIGVVSYAAWIQNRNKLAGSSVILGTLPLPHGKSTEQYRLVGYLSRLGDGETVFSSESLSLGFIRAELFPDLPPNTKIVQTNQMLMKLKEIGDEKLKAFAILTPNEAASLAKLSLPWAVNLKTIADSRKVPSARVISFGNLSPEISKLKKALLAISNNAEANDVLTELRLKGFSNE